MGSEPCGKEYGDVLGSPELHENCILFFFCFEKHLTFPKLPDNHLAVECHCRKWYLCPCPGTGHLPLALPAPWHPFSTLLPSAPRLKQLTSWTLSPGSLVFGRCFGSANREPWWERRGRRWGSSRPAGSLPSRLSQGQRSHLLSRWPLSLPPSVPGTCPCPHVPGAQQLLWCHQPWAPHPAHTSEGPLCKYTRLQVPGCVCPHRLLGP